MTESRSGLRVTGPHGTPVTRMTCPASRVALFRLGVKGMAGGQNGMFLASMALLRRHVADAAVLVLQVVPVHELRTPHTRSFQRLEALREELRALLGCAKQRFRQCVCVAAPVFLGSKKATAIVTRGFCSMRNSIQEKAQALPHKK